MRCIKANDGIDAETGKPFYYIRTPLIRTGKNKSGQNIKLVPVNGNAIDVLYYSIYNTIKQLA